MFPGRGDAYCTSALCPYCPFEGSDQVVDAYFSSCRYVNCVVSGERQCLYDSRCDISGIDEVPCLIAIATDGMDDCRDMMPGKDIFYHILIPHIPNNQFHPGWNWFPAPVEQIIQDNDIDFLSRLFTYFL